MGCRSALDQGRDRVGVAVARLQALFQGQGRHAGRETHSRACLGGAALGCDQAPARDHARERGGVRHLGAGGTARGRRASAVPSPEGAGVQCVCDCAAPAGVRGGVARAEGVRLRGADDPQALLHDRAPGWAGDPLAGARAWRPEERRRDCRAPAAVAHGRRVHRLEPADAEPVSVARRGSRDRRAQAAGRCDAAPGGEGRDALRGECSRAVHREYAQR